MLSFLMLAAYWGLDHSEALSEFLEKVNRTMTHWAVGFYAIVGFVKFTLLIAGLVISISLTIFLIRSRIRKV